MKTNNTSNFVGNEMLRNITKLKMNGNKTFPFFEDERLEKFSRLFDRNVGNILFVSVRGANH